MTAVKEHGPEVGIAPPCQALAAPGLRYTGFGRWIKRRRHRSRGPRCRARFRTTNGSRFSTRCTMNGSWINSRPHVSNGNPSSESPFKTLKYRPELRKRFGSLQEARAFCGEFFRCHNNEHHHSGIGLLTPETVHYRRAARVIEARQRVLDTAHRHHPERFVRKAPVAPALPEAVWINPPDKAQTTRAATEEISLNGLLRLSQNA